MTDGVVVVLFGSRADEWCDLSNCPLGTAEWFPTRSEAEKYVDKVPPGFMPHFITVSKDEYEKTQPEGSGS